MILLTPKATTVTIKVIMHMCAVRLMGAMWVLTDDDELEPRSPLNFAQFPALRGSSTPGGAVFGESKLQ